MILSNEVSFEGAISRLAGTVFLVLYFLVKTWVLYGFFVDPDGKSRIHHRLESIFQYLGRYWQTMLLLILSFSIATVVPLYERFTTQREVLNEFCKLNDPRTESFVCEMHTAASRKWFETLLKDDAVHVFQAGLWLLTIFFIAVVARLVIVRGKSNETRAQVEAVTLLLGVLLWLAGELQDLLREWSPY